MGIKQNTKCFIISGFDLELKKYRLKYPLDRWKLDYAQVVASMINKARIIEIRLFQINNKFGTNGKISSTEAGNSLL
jgi:hypothetical protein